MSSFAAFRPDFLQKMLNPFGLGLSKHTVIKYEALTPDLFLLLLSATDQNQEDHFFVSLETDNIDGLDSARWAVEDWHGSFIRFLPVVGKPDSENIEDYRSVTDGPYFAMLAEVERPAYKGYWSEQVTILPGDNIGEKIKDYNKAQQTQIRQRLSDILRHRSDPNASFLDSFQAKRNGTIVDDKNMTDMAISVYVQPGGKVDCYYNQVKSSSVENPSAVKIDDSTT